MRRSNILLAFVAAGALAAGPVFAERSGNSGPGVSSGSGSGGQQSGQQSRMQRHDMRCSHYMAMNVAGQTTTVNSMRSRMPAANRMPSSHEMARKVAAGCRDHPGMMVHEVLESVMPRTSVMPH